MAGIVAVDDPSDPRLTDYARLTDVRLRTAMEPAHGLFVAEGEKVIRRAVAAGFGVRSMLVTRSWPAWPTWPAPVPARSM